MSSAQDRSTVAKLVGVAAALVAAFVAQKAVEQVWMRTAGHKPPRADDEGDHRLQEVVAAAAVTGAAVALARVLATRLTARYAARHQDQIPDVTPG